MLHFEGDKDFPRPPGELWAKFSDAGFLVQCVPGVETVVNAQTDTAVWILRPGLSFMRGTLEITLEVLERVPDLLVRYRAVSKGIGSTSTVAAAVTFAPREGGARLHWSADVTELGGLLKAVPQGLIKASAQKVIGDVWSALEARLTE